jgi:hypothetical protein
MVPTLPHSVDAWTCTVRELVSVCPHCLAFFTFPSLVSIMPTSVLCTIYKGSLTIFLQMTAVVHLLCCCQYWPCITDFSVLWILLNLSFKFICNKYILLSYCYFINTDFRTAITRPC